MKAIPIALALFGGLSALGGLAIVASTPAEAWYCVARGTTGATGWGTHIYLATAQGIALRQCAVRTPRGAVAILRVAGKSGIRRQTRPSRTSVVSRRRAPRVETRRRSAYLGPGRLVSARFRAPRGHDRPRRIARLALFRRADDGLDRPALPGLPSPADAPRPALYRDGHRRRGRVRAARAADRLRRRASIRSRCSSAARSRSGSPRPRGSAPISATTRSTSIAAARPTACRAAASAPA